MKPGDKVKLKGDVFSNFRNGKELKRYAKKGESVTIISLPEGYNIAIVEGKETLCGKRGFD